MKDFQFKNLKHRCKGYEITHKGGELSKGYKPDVVLNNNNKFIILESEHGTSRKHFIGGMIKSAKFLVNENKGILVFVILIKKNTTELQIKNHLNQYLNWIKNLTNLRDVYVISDSDYCNSQLEEPIVLLSKEFKKLALKV